MKLITLNTWGGRLKEKFEVFFKRCPGIDIWFFQEVYNSKKEDDFVNIGGYNKPDFSFHDTISKHLDSHTKHFCQVFKGIYGLSTFIKPEIKIIGSGEMFIAKGDWYGGDHQDHQDHHRKLQWFEINLGKKNVLLMNVHLTHRPEGKKDSAKRLLQSDMIIKFMNMFDCPKILAGDFNLLPDTESIKMIEETGMRNLIKEYGITSTRTEIYKNPYRYADYVFVSPEITVKEFKVLPDSVSDHSPVYLDFEVSV
jgi:endonuclease/exonuclease/phosphatase family metal-dependent hydrolase